MVCYPSSVHRRPGSVHLHTSTPDYRAITNARKETKRNLDCFHDCNSVSHTPDAVMTAC